MKTRGYLIINKIGSVRFIKGMGKGHRTPYSRPPSVSLNEVAIFLDIELPDALFSRPQLQATITIPKDTAPQTIEAKVLDNCKEAIEKATGLPVRISLVPPPDPPPTLVAVPIEPVVRDTPDAKDIPPEPIQDIDSDSPGG